ncbi:MAG: polysaccharide biosynthesis/export family protein [Verrucomicrobiota bacterium]
MPSKRIQSHESFLHPIRLCGWAIALVCMALLAGCQGGGGGYVPSSEPAPASNAVYRLRVGDVVLLEVFQEPYMTTRQRILGDGTISVGLIGRVAVAGQTINEAAKKIAAQLDQKQLVNPQVNISVETYSPRRFTVWGQVRNPGAMVIPGEEEITLAQALAMAGGNTDIGDIRNVVVTRRTGDSAQKIKLNALSPAASDFLIQEGDTIFVKETLF